LNATLYEKAPIDVEDLVETARAVTTAFTPFFHPMLIEHSVKHGEDTDAGLREQICFIQKALGKSGGALQVCRIRATRSAPDRSPS
jgi:hypothetical protein